MLQEFFKKGATIFIFQIIARVVSFLAFVFIARMLGVESIGSFTYIISLCVLLNMFVEFGTNQFLIKSVALGPDTGFSATVASIVALKLIQFLAGAGLLILIEYESLVENFQALNLTLTYVIFEGFAQIGISVLNGKKQFIRVSKFTFCYEVARSLLLLCVLSFSRSLDFVPLVYITCSIIYAIVIFYFLSREGLRFRSFMQGLRIPKLKIFSYYKHTYLFFLSAIAYQLYFRIDMILLKRLSSPIELGLYSTAYKFFEVFLFVPAIFSGMVFPNIVALYKAGSNLELRSYLEELQTKSVILISSLVVMVITFSDLIVNTFFGSSFSGSIQIMQILFLTSFLYSFNFIYPVLFNSTGNEKYTIYVFISGLALNFILNYSFLPLYGAKAAAVINFACELLVTLLYYVFLSRKGLGIISFKAMAFAICCIGLGAFRIFFAGAIEATYLVVMVFAIFIGILFLFRKDANPRMLMNAKQ